MSKYPVEISDGEGIVDAVNTLLSGPSGLGQNFGGVSYREVKYFTGSNTDPFMTTATHQLQSDTIDIGTGEFLDSVTFRIDFAGAPLGYIPFENSDPVIISGTSYAPINDLIYLIGVVQCTEDYVIIRDTSAAFPVGTTFTGGIVFKTVTQDNFYDASYFWLATDCNSFATVTGETDRVFLAGQADFSIDYDIATIGPSYDFKVRIGINRYKAIPGNPTINPKINFQFEKIVSSVTYEYANRVVPGTIPLAEPAVFVSVIDNPGPGYYWYALEFYFVATGGTGFKVTDAWSFRRSLSTQVVKQ